MITYNKDIYKRILEPAEIKYYVGENINYYRSPSNRKMVWEFLFPRQIRDRMSVSDSSFSALNQGKSDKKNSTDTARDRIKHVLIYPESEYYDYMKTHLKKTVEINSIIAAWSDIHGKSIKKVNLKKTDLEECIAKYPDEVKKAQKKVLLRLSQNLQIIVNDFYDDVRFSEEFWDYVKANINDDPLLVLEVLCLSSIFHDEEDDYSFLEIFERHYLKLKEVVNDDSKTSVKVVEEDFVPINVGYDVFELLESEKKHLELKKNVIYKKNSKVLKSSSVVEQCEENLEQLKEFVSILENNQLGKCK